MKEESYQLLIDKALRFLSFRSRSKYEVATKLKQFAIKKGISEKIVQQVVIDLEEKNLLNDKDFILWWKEQRDTFRPKGIRLLKMELRNKGVDSRLIDEVLKEAENPHTNEFELALSLAQKKVSRISSLPKIQQKEKIASLLSRRGFTWEIIYEVIDTVLKKD
ncbi:hypothetical protein A2773_04430 [Candidatus Gottesmanbacteria bacterium RIFCSPHIGHO2_01_FULL_39_10]|uniref:Regulatory protein RecX n=1 Tax=Candidatus Gottesmanbacteria bacterium RIFCSPHIGHO2_01_FULL_39_10 TaxID=1798375 RepID=A0A1F5ZRM0_9BACT|nr:MAG: hypothetical protein A2773_04430 [Candidatus Gottesmanbacteria bacterium RIFCSPHIGHO2_01_FULL_39_10]